MENNNLSRTKEAYVSPDTESICIAPMESIVNNISNPGGDVPPIEEE